jgi:hypothetical protein
MSDRRFMYRSGQALIDDPGEPCGLSGEVANIGSNAGDEVRMRQCKRRQHLRRGVTGVSRSSGQTKRQQKDLHQGYFRTVGSGGSLKRRGCLTIVTVVLLAA